MAVNSNLSIALNLPPGAVRRVAAGVAAQGWAGISGTYPAGTYLVRSNVACRANFTSNEAVNGYEAAAFKNGDEIVITVPRATNYFEYQSILDSTLVSSQSGDYISTGTAGAFPGAYRIHSAAPYKRGLPIDPYGGNTLYNNITNQAGIIPYRGSFYVYNTSGSLYSWNANQSSPTFIGGLGLAFSPSANYVSYPVATNGTRYVGSWSNQQYFYTDDPSVSTGWNLAVIPSGGNSNHTTFYGGDKWIWTDGTSTYYYSYNAVNWTAGTFPSPPTGISAANSGLAYGNGIWVLMPNSTGSSYYTSADGITWTTRSFLVANGSNSTVSPWAIAFGNGRFVCQSNAWNGATVSPWQNAVAVSTDGINWTRSQTQDFQLTSSLSYYGRVGFSGTTFMWSNTADVQNEPAAFSFDGVNWLPAAGRYEANSLFYNQTIKGTRGQSFLGSTSYLLFNHAQRGAKFEVYLLDPGFKTY